MRRLLFLLALVIAVPTSDAYAQCVPKSGSHQRWTVKTRPTPTGGVHAVTVTVADLIARDIPHRTDHPDTVLMGTDEETVFSLYAYVLLAKCSGDDGDIHLEVADTPRATAPRVVVEIPRRLLTEQGTAAELLGKAKIGTTPIPFSATTAVRLHFMGYGFFDLSHAAKDFRKAGNGSHGSAKVKTILELHPVFGVGKGH